MWYSTTDGIRMLSIIFTTFRKLSVPPISRLLLCEVSSIKLELIPFLFSFQPFSFHFVLLLSFLPFSLVFLPPAFLPLALFLNYFSFLRFLYSFPFLSFSFSPFRPLSISSHPLFLLLSSYTNRLQDRYDEQTRKSLQC